MTNPETSVDLCVYCDKFIQQDDDSSWRHVGTGRVYCPGGEQYGMWATPTEPEEGA